MKILVSMFIATFALSTPAMAQREVFASMANPFDRMITGPSRPSDAEKQLAFEVQARDFAECVVGAEPQKARQLLALEPQSRAQANLLRTIAYSRDGCSASARARDTFMRGVLAEQIYLRDFPARIEARPPATAAFVSSPWRDLALYDYAACVVGRDPAGADTVLRADPRSKTENSAYAAIMPALSSCIAGGATVQMDRTALRGYLAEALYSHRRG